MFLLKEEIPLCAVTATTFMLCSVPLANIQVLEKPLEFLLLEGRALF